MSIPKVDIVIVNYNCEQLTRECLQSLRNLTYSNFAVTLVDNASPDGSGDRLARDFSHSVRVICSGINRGFAAGCNIGIRAALQSSADFVWLLNPDTEVEPNSLSELVKVVSSHDGVVAAGSKVLYAPTSGHQERRLWGAGGRIDVASRTVEMVGAGEPDDGRYDVLRECDYIPGCSLLVSRRIIERVGMMPEEYFMYFEETDWCVRMRRAKGRLLYVPTSIVYHKFDDEKLSGPFMVYYYNRNNNLFWSRQLGGLKRLRLFLRVALKDLPRAREAERACADVEQKKVFRAHVRAAGDFLRHRYGYQQSPD